MANLFAIFQSINPAEHPLIAELERFCAFFLRVAESISQGLGVTLGIFFFTITLSLPLGLLISFGAISNAKLKKGSRTPKVFALVFLRGFVKVYIWLLRGTPLLLQLLFVYFGVPMILKSVSANFGVSFELNLDNYTASVLAFVLNYAAYFAEIFRAGIQSIDTGQYEAAKALGLTPTATMFCVVIPQMVRRVLPPIGNEAITLVKDTSLVSIIALSDILNRTHIIVMREANVSAFFVAAVFYLIMTFILTQLFNYLERKTAFGEANCL